VIRIKQGKGGKDRYIMLSPQLLQILRTYWRLARPGQRLFPGQNPAEPKRADRQHARDLSKAVWVRTLRHSFATHLLEADTEIRIIQAAWSCPPVTTARYTQVSAYLIADTTSPLDRLSLAVTPPSWARRLMRPVPEVADIFRRQGCLSCQPCRHPLQRQRRVMAPH
jgi:integrase/recombinase XerD